MYIQVIIFSKLDTFVAYNYSLILNSIFTKLFIYIRRYIIYCAMHKELFIMYTLSIQLITLLHSKSYVSHPNCTLKIISVIYLNT